jgi:Tfp pilus assembly protein PilO
MAMDTPILNKNAAKIRDYGSPVIQVILLLVVLVLFSWYMIKPKLADLKVTKADLQSSQDQLAGVQQDKKDLTRLISDLHSATTDVAKVDEALPLNDRVSKLYLYMDSLVRSSGMTLTLISQDDVSGSVVAGDKKLLENPFQPGRQLHTISIGTSVSGTMEQFKNLLQLMETSGRVIDVDDIEVIGGDPITKFRLNVKAYSYEKPDPKAIKNAD